jgi:subtilisin family serine protease
MSISIVLMISFIISISTVPVSHGENGDIQETVHEGPPLWTHSGPVSISSLEELFSTGDINTDYFIIQFKGPVGEPQIKMMENNGLEVLDYFPDYAYVIHSNGFSPEDLEDLPGVHGISPFYPGLKVHPDILIDHRNGLDPFEGFNSITIETFTPESIEQELSSMGGFFMRTKETRYVVSKPIPFLEDLMELDGVKWIEPRSEMVLMNDVAEGIIDVDQVWDDLGLDGSGQTVGISDTGIDTGVDNPAVYGDMHLDLDNRIEIFDWSGSGPDDDNGHGTHVAGSVAGDGSRSNGNIKGMAYNSSVYFQALETDSGFLNTPSNLSQLFTQAYSNGARIHTNSWGSSVSALWGAYTAEAFDVDWSMFTTPDLLILYSAGNEGNDGNSDGKVDQNSVSPPATAKSSIAVGASENIRSVGGFQGSWGAGWPADFPVNPLASDRPSNNSNGLAAFSSRGPLDDGRLKPDIVAPGTNILSVRSSRGSASGWGFYNSSYIYFGGTSMSAPITAGMAALVRQYYNQTLGIGSPLASLLKATIINGASDMAPGQYGAANPSTREISGRPDVDQGWGRINMKNSVDPDGGKLSFIDNKSGLRTGENITRMFRVASSQNELRLTLAWSDFPGSLFAGKQLINDLDLIVIAPNGTRFNGNDFVSPFNDQRDSVNPVEGISVKNPVPGWWKVIVEGNNIPRGPQHFSLVATGNITDFISNMLLLDRPHYSTDSDMVSISLSSRDHSGEGSVSVFISSTTDPSGKNITLLEETTLGAFTGSFITSNISTVDPLFLHVSDGDMIFVEFDSPYGFFFSANASARKPKRVDLVQLPENRLTYSRYDNIRLRGIGDPGLEVEWTVPGSDLPWIGIFDDGIPSHGDESGDDGIYNVVFYVSNEYFVDGNITLRVKDPYLGLLYYEQFELRIDPTIPGAPVDLEAVSLPSGNSVRLGWSRSPGVGVTHYSIFINLTGNLPGFDPSGWYRYSNTTGPENRTIITGLSDGINYHFRVAAVNGFGNRSSLSLWVDATPEDILAPVITYDEAPVVLTGVATIPFNADEDLEKLELQYYIDSDGDGIANDNGSYLPASNSTDPELVWDTRIEFGGPGDIDKMILRWRGSDEVPNLSNWTYMSGFGIDNTPPPFLELSTYPPRVTNGTSFDIIGDTEPLAMVEAALNGVDIGTFPAGMTGIFDLSIDLNEGVNYLNLTAYDLHGAGPRRSDYIFTRDTSDPIARIRQVERLIEIRCNCTTFVSDSFDVGSDPEFTEIANETWILEGPFGATSINFGRTLDHNFERTGNYSLTLKVRDHAMNRDEETITFEVVDRTPPVPVISGPVVGDEDTTYQFSMEGSIDNDPELISEERADVLWIFQGPLGFYETSERYESYVLFPEPGIYGINLKITDGGGNNATVNGTIEIRDITPPNLAIEGDRVFDPGESAWFNATVDDNAPAGSPQPEYLWQLFYLDGGSDIPLSSTEESSFRITMIDPGNYSLKLTVSDPSGNSRNESIQLLVRKPVIISGETPQDDDAPPYDYIAYGLVVIGIVMLLGIIIFAAGRRRFSDDVDMDWEEDDMDIDELDGVEDEENEIDWDDDDWEDWE